MTDKTSRGQGEVVADFEQLLDALVGNEVPHGGTVVRTNNDAALERDSHRACAGLHNSLLF